MSTPPQLKLTYFDFGGRAELARLLFTYGGISFEDERVSGVQFMARKPSLPLGQVPVLQVDGVIFSQSMAIARYAAKVSELYPHDPIHALHVDMVSETLVDLVEIITNIFFRTADKTVQAGKASKFFADELPKILTALERMVRGDKSFLADGSVSMAGVQLFEVVENGLKPFSPDFSTDAYPKLTNVLKNVRASARIAAYLANGELWERCERELEHGYERVVHEVEQVHVCERCACVPQEKLATHHAFEHLEGRWNRHFKERLGNLGLLVGVLLRERRDEGGDEVANDLGDHVHPHRINSVMRVQSAERSAVPGDRKALGEDNGIDLEHWQLAQWQRGLECQHLGVRDALVLERDATEREEQTRELNAAHAIKVRELEPKSGTHDE